MRRLLANISRDEQTADERIADLERVFPGHDFVKEYDERRWKLYFEDNDDPNVTTVDFELMARVAQGLAGHLPDGHTAGHTAGPTASKDSSREWTAPGAIER